MPKTTGIWGANAAPGDSFSTTTSADASGCSTVTPNSGNHFPENTRNDCQDSAGVNFGEVSDFQICTGDFSGSKDPPNPG